jgi:arylsulfatase A-like enzyme/outer membrane protein assembly factor BamB
MQGPKLRRLLILSLAALSWTGVFEAGAANAGRPNVVLILIDDLGGHDLGCYGSTFHRTPHLDRLAADGLKFTDAYAACPVCSPTRASILTGKYPARLHLTDWLPGRPDRPDQRLLRPALRGHLLPEDPTLAEVLHQAGYATGHIGKWHLGGEGFGPRQRGFDLNIAGDHTGTPLSYFAPFRDKKGRFMPGLEHAPEGQYLTDRLTAEAEKFIERNRERPFFLYLAHYAVHIPLRARAEAVAKYPRDRPPGTQNSPVYAAMIEAVDDGVGRIVEKLEELKLSERTLVLFTSDNGGLCVTEGPSTPATINAPLREGKGFLYEGGIRVPLLLKWPGIIRPGRVSNAPVCSIDFFPTILEACGVTSAARPDGVSLLPVFKGEGLTREALYWHYPHYSNQGGKPGGAVRAGAYKLIEFFEQGRRELYNLKADVGETVNLIEQQPRVAAELAGKLADWRRAVGAEMTRPNPDYVPNPQAAEGTVTLHAKTAEVHGIQLRYEPLPHKNVLGFWSRAEDWASWEFQISRPGTFAVEILQGCGKGQGGSAVELAVAGQTLAFAVEDTGDFHALKARAIGKVRLERPGRYTLTVKPTRKARGAVMDLRTVVLKPAEELLDWPQFRGPDGQGHSAARGLPLRWSETENVRWKVPIPGRGWSSPVVGEGRVWVTTALDGGRSLRAVGLDAATGQVLHNVEVFHVAKPISVNPKNSHASPTPVLEPGRLYVHFGTLGTACLATDTGKILWTNQELRLDHKEGPGSSPILCGDRLIVNCDGMDVQYVAALDKQTGQLAWKAPRTGARNPDRDRRKAYATPLVIEVGGRTLIVSPGAERANAYDPATGKELWWVDYPGYSNVPRPVFGQGLVFLCTGFERPEVWAVRPEGQGDVTKTGVVWRQAKQAPANPSPLLVGDVLYTVSDRGIVTARSAQTGREMWSERLGGAVSASPLYADGRVYVCEEEGTTSVFRPGPRFELLARNVLDGRVQASPAVAGRALFLRTERHLYRIEEAAK